MKFDDFTLLIPVLISFLISVVLCPILIPFLRKLKFGQTVRDEGPASHLKKNGTPTMGGLVILFSVLITSLIYVGRYPDIIPVLFMTLGFGIIGFLDDYIKVVKKRSLGLTPLQKIVLQFIVTAVFTYYYFDVAKLDTQTRIPFVEGYAFSMPLNTRKLITPKRDSFVADIHRTYGYVSIYTKDPVWSEKRDDFVNLDFTFEQGNEVKEVPLSEKQHCICVSSDESSSVIYWLMSIFSDFTSDMVSVYFCGASLSGLKSQASNCEML